MPIQIVNATDLSMEELACLLRAEIAPEPKEAIVDTLLALAEQILHPGPKHEPIAFDASG